MQQSNKTTRLRLFAVGALEEEDVLKALFGYVPEGVSGHVNGYVRCIQHLSQIPAQPQLILRKKWPATFRTYGLTARRNATAPGTVWNITETDYEKVKAWQLVAEGWMQSIVTYAHIGEHGAAEVTTEVIPDGQTFDSSLTNAECTPFLNDREHTLRIAGEIAQLIAA